MKLLRAVRMARCIGCHSCSLACARLVHRVLSWDRAGIRIRSSGGLTTGFEARLCLGCDPAPCVAACPTEALRQRRGGGVIFKREPCIQCGACARACPVDAIYLDCEQRPYVCIHCGRCIPFCPHDCLALVTVDAEPIARGQAASAATAPRPADGERAPGEGGSDEEEQGDG